jgi:hypothetical protein
MHPSPCILSEQAGTKPFTESAEVRAKYNRPLDHNDGLGYARFPEGSVQADGVHGAHTLMIVPQVEARDLGLADVCRF